MSRLDPVSQLLISACRYSMVPKKAIEDLAQAAEAWLQAFPDEREGPLHQLADLGKDVRQVIPLERSESARLVGVALGRATQEQKRRLALAGITPRETGGADDRPRHDRWTERADLQ